MFNKNQPAIDKYICEDLKQELKQRVYDDILNQLVEEFKKDIEPVLKEHFEKISIKSVEKHRNLMNLTDEIQVLVKGVKDEQ